MAYEGRVFCTRCYEFVEPRVVKTPTFTGEVILEYYCPRCGKLLDVKRARVELPVREAAGGFYVAIDGIEGSGKTTQVEALVKWLRGMGCRVLTVREPYTTEVRKIVRERDVDVEAEVLLYVADRIIMQREFLIPALRDGAVVVGDRSPYSTAAYQSALGYPEELIWALHSRLRMPDVAIILDVPVDVALKRSPPHNKYQRAELLERVRENFLKIAKERGLHVVDATRPVEEVAKEVREAVKDRVKC